MKNTVQVMFIILAGFIISFILYVLFPRQSFGNPTTEQPSHFVACTYMKSAIPVYGDVTANGSYLYVRISKNSLDRFWIGANCAIVPNGDLIK